MVAIDPINFLLYNSRVGFSGYESAAVVFHVREVYSVVFVGERFAKLHKHSGSPREDPHENQSKHEQIQLLSSFASSGSVRESRDALCDPVRFAERFRGCRLRFFLLFNGRRRAVFDFYFAILLEQLVRQRFDSRMLSARFVFCHSSFLAQST